jgi:CHAT domain-containing protein
MLVENVTVLRDDEATVANFRYQVSKATTIHMAGHGCFLKSHTGATGIRLHDRWLTLNEISSLQLNAELVVLSSCESGPSTPIEGDEATGLFQGFLAGGVKGLLVSMWRISDESTKKTFAFFYRNMQSASDEYTVGTALQQAQIEVMKEHPHPAHWASFIFTGVDQ